MLIFYEIITKKEIIKADYLFEMHVCPLRTKFLFLVVFFFSIVLVPFNSLLIGNKRQDLSIASLHFLLDLNLLTLL